MGFDTRTAPSPVTTNSATQTINVTIGSGTNRVAVVAALFEATSAVVNGVKFDPAGLNTDFSSCLVVQHGTASTLRLSIWRYNIADEVPAGTYIAQFTMSSSAIANQVTLYARSIDQAANGELFVGSDSKIGTDANASLSATSSADAMVLAYALNASAAATWTWSGGVSEDGEQNEGGYTTSDASGTASGSSTTVTAADGATSNKLLGVIVIGVASGEPPTNARRPTFLRAVRRLAQRYLPSRVWTGAVKVAGAPEPPAPGTTASSVSPTRRGLFRGRASRGGKR